MSYPPPPPPPPAKLKCAIGSDGQDFLKTMYDWIQLCSFAWQTAVIAISRIMTTLDDLDSIHSFLSSSSSSSSTMSGGGITTDSPVDPTSDRGSGGSSGRTSIVLPDDLLRFITEWRHRALPILSHLETSSTPTSTSTSTSTRPGHLEGLTVRPANESFRIQHAIILQSQGDEMVERITRAISQAGDDMRRRLKSVDDAIEIRLRDIEGVEAELKSAKDRIGMLLGKRGGWRSSV